MATLETFKGTTAQVHAALKSTPPLIGDNTVVTITDGAYTLNETDTGLIAIISAVGQNKVILEKAASTPIKGTATELKDMLAGVSSYAGDLEVTDPSVSAADLNTIAKGTTGKVKATLDVATQLTKATVDALADVKATDIITFEPTAITADAAILVAINKIISNAKFTAVATITAAAADVALVKEALTYDLAATPVVTITGAISAADVNAIAAATTGKVTATIADGTVAATLKAIKNNVNGDDVITFKTTDTTVKATELKALKDFVDTLDATSIKTITATAVDVAADVAAAAAVAPTANVTITGSILAANASLIAKETTGVLTATITGDTATNLLTALALNTNTSDILALTVTDGVAADIVALLEKTGGKIKVTSGTVNGSIEDLTSIYVTNKAKFEGLGNEDVTISGGGVSAAQLNAIAAATSGKVIATLSSDTPLNADTVAALKDVKTTDTITFVSEIDTLDSVEALNALLAIKKIITGANFTAVTTIEADAKDIALVKEVLKYVEATVAVTINGEISAADAAAIAQDSDLTATIKAGTVKDTLKAIEDVDAADVITFKTTDTSVDATELVALEALVDTLDVSSVKTITSATQANVAEALAIVEDANVTITGSITAANAKTIAEATEGVLTATIDADTATSLLGALGDTNTSDILALTVNDASLTAAGTIALVSLLEKTGGKIKVTSGTVTGSIEDLTSIYVTNKAKFEGLGNEAVNITDADGVSAAQLNAIAAATSGKVTATLSPDTPLNADTVKALKDVNSKDAINFGVTEVKSKEEISALLNLKKILPALIIDLDTIEADAKDIALVKDVLKLSKDAAVTINGEISAADANIIAKSGDGALTATIKAGSVAATLKAIKDVKTTDTIKFKTTDKSADASELKALKELVDDFDASSVKTITATAAQAGDIVDALAIAEDAAVTITGNVAVGDIKTILDATTGKVTATLEADIAENIATALADINNEVNAINVTVNGNTASAQKLLDIKDSTSGKITVTAKDVSGSFDELKELYVTSKGKFTALGDENVTITGTVSAADANIIAKAVNGKVTATVADDTAAALVASLKDAKATDALTLKVNGESAKASELNVLDGKTSGTVTVEGDVVISGNIADLTKVFAAGSGITTANNAVTILGTVSAKDANAIATKTTDEVTANIAADTAAKLKEALTDGDDNVLNLTVNGAKADASDLKELLGKTAGKITVTAKEISGSLTDIKEVLVTSADKFTGLDKVAVKITGATVPLTDLDAILAATSGIVTATVASNTAANLVDALANAKANDALKLKVTDTDPVNAADLLALDGKTSITVDAEDVSIRGTAADVKKLLASKGVSLLKNVNITLDADTEVSAADVNAIAKATGGKVTATAVAAGTAAALNKALGNATKDDEITLEVSGKTATAADLLALDGKTSVKVGAAEVESITGTVADLKKVFAANNASTLDVADEVAVSVSGTVKASDLKDVLTTADGIVTATVAAGKAADLKTNLADNPENALKVTITDTKVDAADLLALDLATSIAVNAASVKTITGDAAHVKAAYEAGADKGISGLGNEAVDLTDALDANAELVSAINDFTTGLIKLPTITFKTAEATTFSLSDLGDLNGITGLVNINADNGQNDTISISLKDLLAANDSKDDFTFNLNLSTGDAVDIANDVSGWTKAQTTLNKEYTYTNDKTGQVVTIVADEAVITA